MENGKKYIYNVSHFHIHGGKNMRTVADIIGEDYKNRWDRLNEYDDKQYCYGGGNCIFISAPTGSGKTFFILNIWLK